MWKGGAEPECYERVSLFFESRLLLLHVMPGQYSNSARGHNRSAFIEDGLVGQHRLDEDYLQVPTQGGPRVIAGYSRTAIAMGGFIDSEHDFEIISLGSLPPDIRTQILDFEALLLSSAWQDPF